MDYPDEEHVVKILNVQDVTHNVKRFTLSRPDNYFFKAGQATDIVINKPEWKEERRPFTFTGLNEWDNLEFTIKIYSDHQGVTNQLGLLKIGDELILHDVWGAISYKGEGVFIAGGAGVTPFIAIFRQLKKEGKIGNNQLLFSNKSVADIILNEEFQEILGENFINTLTDEKDSRYKNGIIDADFLKQTIKISDQYFYICGPDPMIESIAGHLENLGVKKDKIIKEEF
ncbi:MAG: FAD-binding oxidoreductase [Ginsengibacter sp.]